jgi:hypothetical protein
MKSSSKKTIKSALRGATTASIAILGATTALAFLNSFMSKKVDEVVDGPKKENEENQTDSL